MSIPRHTRILLIPEDDQRVREYHLSRGMAVTLLSLLAVAVIALAVLFVTLAGQQSSLRRFRTLETEMEAARQDIQTVQRLRRELEETRQLQERLLVMLGVTRPPEAGADSLAGRGWSPPDLTGRSLPGTAASAPGPEPRRWPAAGYVTREFKAGAASAADLAHSPAHEGIDIAGAPDTPVLAAADGEVVRTGKDDFLGNFVEIRHGLGYLTVYGHCARLAVNPGDQVLEGQVIAYMGKSGQATATHLHFEVWQQGEVVDPRRVLPGNPPQK